RGKMVIFKRVFVDELPRMAKEIFIGLKLVFWDDNDAKIYSFVIAPIIFFLAWMLFFLSTDSHSQGAILPAMLCTCTTISLFICLLASSTHTMTDKKIGEIVVQLPKFIVWMVPKFIIWNLPKFLLWVIILTIYKAHSIELVAVSLYSLFGMLYIFIFPPFQLAPTAIFLMAGGCGIFTGLCGLGMNKVLSMSFAQRVFAKVEAW
ncbi:MAG: hypothetical protein L6275_03985, partial [Candidatus Portnoybacteria bacterium]|nr:hypothetical protein [Candidatus Portnoybacteria bacterium]